MSLATSIVTGVLRLVSISATLPSIYDASENIATTITSGTAHTLPSSGSYTGDELEVYFNGQVLDPTTDYSSVGTGTKTQISFTFNLLSGDHLRYRTIRGP